jgi:tetratricopeptide (TPR) repeat protein
VPPLEVEDGSALFRARARAVDPSFIPTPAVDELCARLDELPLAIELGAARTAVFSPEQLLERLSQRLDLLKGDRDAVPRQQTLRATIEWSHDLLTTEEQRLFARLAIFVGGCTYEAAEEVAGADPETLQSLLDKSLVRKRVAGDAPRYWMLETIREYAGEHLDASGESDALRRRHAEHFLALAEEAEPHVEHVPGVWIERLEADTDNLRAARDQLEAAGESERALRLAGSLAGFWEAGYLAEGLNRLERVLSLDERPTAGRAKALAGAARVARMSGDSPTTMLRAEEARALYVELGDSLGTAHSGVLLGLAAADEGDFSQALQLFDESARLFREAGDEEEALFPVRLLGWVYEELGDYERARAVHEVNLGRARALGNKQMEGQSLGALANLALHDGRARDGVSILQGVLRIDRDLGIRIQTTLDLTRFARALAFVRGAAAEATQLLSCAAARREEIGAGTPPAYVVAMNEEAIAAIREELDDRAFTEAWEQGRALTLDQAVELAVDYVE